MSTTLPGMTPEVRSFVEGQQIFFVGSAPENGGHVNVSPKGLDSFRILADDSVGYYDLTGSGAETQAHLEDNGRIVVMFCAFDSSAKIIRFHGTGVCHLPGSRAFDAIFDEHGGPEDVPLQGVRGFIEIAVDRVSRSCGFGVPEFEVRKTRDNLPNFFDHKGVEAMANYRTKKNTVSIDGLPVLPPGQSWATMPSVTTGRDVRIDDGDHYDEPTPGSTNHGAEPELEHTLESSPTLGAVTAMEQTIKARRDADPGESYSARLLADSTLVQRKIIEEAFEVCLELGASPTDLDRLNEEAADLVYHLTVALVGAGSSLAAVDAVLRARHRP